MSNMNAEIYDAFLAAGVPDEKARKAAQSIANNDARILRVEIKLNILIALSGAIAAGVFLPFFQ